MSRTETRDIIIAIVFIVFFMPLMIWTVNQVDAKITESRQ